MSWLVGDSVVVIDGLPVARPATVVSFAALAQIPSPSASCHRHLDWMACGSARDNSSIQMKERDSAQQPQGALPIPPSSLWSRPGTRRLFVDPSTQCVPRCDQLRDSRLRSCVATGGRLHFRCGPKVGVTVLAVSIVPLVAGLLPRATNCAESCRLRPTCLRGGGSYPVCSPTSPPTQSPLPTWRGASPNPNVQRGTNPSAAPLWPAPPRCPERLCSTVATLGNAGSPPPPADGGSTAGSVDCPRDSEGRVSLSGAFDDGSMAAGSPTSVAGGSWTMVDRSQGQRWPTDCSAYELLDVIGRLPAGKTLHAAHLHRSAPSFASCRAHLHEPASLNAALPPLLRHRWQSRAVPSSQGRFVDVSLVPKSL